jgi:hypothetical protein
MYFGAACPDLPYAMLLGDQSSWADQLHYHDTNTIVETGVRRIRLNWDPDRATDQVRLAWLFGYASHVIFDVVVHPVIENLVGKYSDANNRLAHRECEKMQDSLLFYEVKNGLDITHAESSDRFDNCRRSVHFTEIMSFWLQILEAGYPDVTPHPEPEKWFSVFRLLFDQTDNSQGITAVFRHAGIGKPGTIVYTSQRELRAMSPEKCRKYYDELKLPNGNAGSFKSDVFNKAVSEVCDLWDRIFKSLGSPEYNAQFTQNWNLDTGIAEGTEMICYWSG